MDVVELVQEATAHTDEEWSRDKQKLWICVCVCVCVCGSCSCRCALGLSYLCKNGYIDIISANLCAYLYKCNFVC